MFPAPSYPAIPAGLAPATEVPEDVAQLPLVSPAAPHPKRPGYGTAGRAVNILANWFQVEFNIKEAYQYDVVVTKVQPPPGSEEEGGKKKGQPRRAAAAGPLPAKICRAAMSKLAQDRRWPRGSWAFDGRANVYTATASLVPDRKIEWEGDVTLPDEPPAGHPHHRPMRLTVKVELAAVIDVNLLGRYIKGLEQELPRHALQALDVALKQQMGLNTLLQPRTMALGRSFLRYQPMDTSIGGGAEVWLGYKQALRPCQSGLALTLDTASGAVWDAGDPIKPRPLIELMYDLLGDVRGPLSPMQIRTLDRALRGVKVQAQHNSFKRAIAGFSQKPPHAEMFQVSTGREISVAQYFQEQYNVAVRDRNLPCVKTGAACKVLLPAEVCIVLPKQRYSKVMNGDQTTAMLRLATEKPQDKLKKLQAQILEVEKEANAELAAFGLRLSKQLMTVKARVLPAPQLMYGHDANYRPQPGSWNLQRAKFHKGTVLRSWAVVAFGLRSREQEGLEPFLQEFVRGLRSYSVMVPEGRPPLVEAKRNLTVLANMQHAAKMAAEKYKVAPMLLVAILPDQGAHLYREVKQASDSALGICSQCMVAGKAGLHQAEPRGRPQYIANVAMKVNAKLGGVNVALSAPTVAKLPAFLGQLGSKTTAFTAKPFMIFGADVTHAAPGSLAPSLAAVVGSLEATAGRYAARVSKQAATPGRQTEEIIYDMKRIAKELLMEFYRHTAGKKPERIFFYRDGVSEGQFDQVLKYEYSSLRHACSELGGDAEYAPPITFLTVQKRHQTRIFPMTAAEGDRSGNVQPGTVVDGGITHPAQFDFYLNAHAGLQGTNRPAHYQVLADENKFGVDGLQQLTYWLCYLFTRCTRSISVCPPARYAHLAAFRARLMLYGGDGDATSSVSGESARMEMLPIHANLSSSMFYS